MTTSLPRVLIVVLGRINAADATSNGLLVRNVFGDWPRERLAQVFSSGSNGDPGFCGAYYELGAADRWFGTTFRRLKARALTKSTQVARPDGADEGRPGPRRWLVEAARRQLVDTGFYELVFRPRLSNDLVDWAREFRPQLIFAQGYNLAFARLPRALASRLSVPIAYYPTDDWPHELHHARSLRGNLLSRLVNGLARRAERDLVSAAALRIAFNPYMREEYEARHRRPFEVLMHGDDARRFAMEVPRRDPARQEIRIAAMGVFNRSRYPLLHDVDDACRILTSRGRPASLTVYRADASSVSAHEAQCFRHVKFESSPDHADVPATLSHADVLLLAERFDESVADIKLSISSKAHLFMFSGRPTIVYSDPCTGVARYAREEGWAAVVGTRDSSRLAEAIERLACDEHSRAPLVERALAVAHANHDLSVLRGRFAELASAAVRAHRVSNQAPIGP